MQEVSSKLRSLGPCGLESHGSGSAVARMGREGQLPTPASPPQAGGPGKRPRYCWGPQCAALAPHSPGGERRLHELHARPSVSGDDLEHRPLEVTSLLQNRTHPHRPGHTSTCLTLFSRPSMTSMPLWLRYSSRRFTRLCRPSILVSRLLCKTEGQQPQKSRGEGTNWLLARETAPLGEA